MFGYIFFFKVKTNCHLIISSVKQYFNQTKHFDINIKIMVDTFSYK